MTKHLLPPTWIIAGAFLVAVILPCGVVHAYAHEKAVEKPHNELSSPTQAESSHEDIPGSCWEEPAVQNAETKLPIPQVVDQSALNTARANWTLSAVKLSNAGQDLVGHQSGQIGPLYQRAVQLLI